MSTALRISSVRSRGSSETTCDGVLVGAGGKTFRPSTRLSDIPPILPNNGKPSRGLALSVSGIMTDMETQLRSSQALANTGLSVISVHNATEGLLRDLTQCVLDKLGKGKNAAVDTLVFQMGAALKRGEPLRVVAHSQGALDVARALKVLKRQWKAGGLSNDEIKVRFAKLSVETYGGSAGIYPDGPDYYHKLNRYDPVPMLTGLGLPFSRPGAGAKVVRFKQFENPMPIDARHGAGAGFATVLEKSVHGCRSVYFPRRDTDLFG